MKINQNLMKKLSFLTISLNLATAVLGIFYFAIPVYSLFWDIFGVIMIVSWLINFVLLYINDQHLVKTDATGKKINHVCYFFLVFIIVAMLLMVANNALLSATISTKEADFVLPFVMVSVAFFGIAAFGIWLGYLDISNLDNRGAWKFE